MPAGFPIPVLMAVLLSFAALPELASSSEPVAPKHPLPLESRPNSSTDVTAAPGSGKANAGARFGQYDWSAAFPTLGGPDGSVRAIVRWDDGTGPAWVIGGEFQAAGGVQVSGVAIWNGRAWAPIGEGLPGTVYSLAVHRGDLYAGGNLRYPGASAAFGVARWTGSGWEPVGAGVNGLVYSLASDGASLYAGGGFSVPGSANAGRNIARWDGRQWSVLGNGLDGSLGPTVRSLSVHSGWVCAGGIFNRTPGDSTLLRNIACWDGARWQALGSGVGGLVYALSSYRGALVAGGQFETAGGVPARNLARWDGASWQPFGDGADREVWALAVEGERLLAGGNFRFVDGIAALTLAEFDGQRWSNSGLDPDLALRAIAIDSDVVIAGGFFSSIGERAASRVAWRRGQRWEALGEGLSLPARDALEFRGQWVIGGSFGVLGSPGGRGVAAWDGRAWQPLGGGTDGSAGSLLVHGNDLIAAGSFASAGGEPAVNIARWNGQHWQAMGDGLADTIVQSLVEYQGAVVAAGDFRLSGSSSLGRVARWDGDRWHDLGEPFDGAVRSLVVHRGVLYSGGFFSSAGGVQASKIARWDGADWQALDGAALAPVQRLYSGGDGLYVGTTPDRDGVWHWNGSGWVRVGWLFSNADVSALTEFEGVLVSAGNVFPRYFDGDFWRPLGNTPGLGESGALVGSMAVHQGALFAAGRLHYGSRVMPDIGRFGPEVPTLVEHVEVSPPRPALGEPVTIKVRVAGAGSAPRGRVLIAAAPGGSCTTEHLVPTSADAATESCTIRWTRSGPKHIQVRYLGGTDTVRWWAPASLPAPLVVSVESLLVDGFE